jgi:hypothetical protein
MLGVGDGIPDDVFEEAPEDATDFFVDGAADLLDAPATSTAPDGRLRDPLHVLSHDLSMTLGTTLSKTLPAFASAGHFRHEVFPDKCRALLIQLWR